MISFNSEIEKITAREILDSRGKPTVEACVVLRSGAYGIASVPSGASTGAHEAREHRDSDKGRYNGMGVLNAVNSLNTRIMPSLVGVRALDQLRLDSIMIALDATQNKSNLGANAILSVSLAAARAASEHIGMPLYRYIGGSSMITLPIPMMNILNGGAHADNNIDIQEFMILPNGADNFTEAVRMGSEVYAMLKSILKRNNFSTAVGDEGGFAPALESEAVALDLIVEAIERAGYKPGEEISLALDVASSEWYRASKADYHLPKRECDLDRENLLKMLYTLSDKYPIVSIEDGMAEDDIEGWQMLSAHYRGSKMMLVGDDLFVTNKKRLRMGMREKIANSILIKPNQIGSVSEACDTVNYAKTVGYSTVMSHRSGETADSFIADLAVALGTGFIKTGAPCRSERTEKYNRLMRIESELFAPIYAGESF